MKKVLVFLILGFFVIVPGSVIAQEETKEEINIEEFSGHNKESNPPVDIKDIATEKGSLKDVDAGDSDFAKESLLTADDIIKQIQEEKMSEIYPEVKLEPLTKPLFGKKVSNKELKDAFQKKADIYDTIQKAKLQNGDLDSYEQLIALELKVLQEHNQSLRKELDRLHSELADVYHILGTMYSEQKFYGKAIKAFEKSVGYGSDNPMNYYHLGLLYEFFHGNTTKSLSYLAEYLKTDPPFEKRKKVQKLVEILTKSTDKAGR